MTEELRWFTVKALGTAHAVARELGARRVEAFCGYTVTIDPARITRRTPESACAGCARIAAGGPS